MANKLLQDREGNASSKRVFGSVGMGFFMALSGFLAIYSIYTGNDVGSNAASLVSAGFGISAALLGISVVEFFGKKGQ